MAHKTAMVDVRDQLLVFAKDAMGSDIAAASWTTDLLYGVPEEADKAGMAFPIGAVLWTLDADLFAVGPEAAGLIDIQTLALWLCFETKSTVSSVAAQDAAVALAEKAINALRSVNGRSMNYGGNTAAAGTSVKRVLISRTREAGRAPGGSYWVATTAILVHVKNYKDN